MKHLNLPLWIMLPVYVLPAAAASPCSFLPQAEAEAILGESVVSRSDSASNCSFVQKNFAGGTGPNNKQVSLSIWRSASPKADDVNARKADIARDPTMARTITKEVPDFADAAIWSWMPNWGRFNAFKGGIVQVQIIIAGIPEDAALRNAKKLAERALGSAEKSGFAYSGAGGGSMKTRGEPGKSAGAPRSAAALSATAPETAISPASYSAAWLGQSKTVRGTVSRLEMKSEGSPNWLTIYFRESPDGAFVVCSPHPDMFTETVGDLYRLVGKTLEVTGPVESSMCAGRGGSIRVVESSGYRVEGPPVGTLTIASGSVPRKHNPNEARLGLDICNAGKADIDAAIDKQGRTTMFHVPSAQCAHVYEDRDGPVSVGFAFADARGQWQPARRVAWNALSSELWSQGSGKNMSVRRGDANVVVPAQMLFHPPKAMCYTRTNYETQYDPRHPYDARYARQVVSGTTTECDSNDYDLNAIAYPETHEVAFEKKCYLCPPTSSPAEQARSREEIHRTTAAMSKISPQAGGFMAGIVGALQTKAVQESTEGAPEYRLMSWDELRRVPARPPGGGRPSEMPRYFAMRGTVSRVEVRPVPSGINEPGPWVNVYFRESAEQTTGGLGTSYGAFNVCTFGTDIFESMFGPDYRTRMIGQVLEVQGEYGHGCMGWKGSIRISLAHQVRRIASR
jgi:hypothetical protein